MVLLWGSPMQFPYKSYGECMELYEIRSNPIGVDNRMWPEKKQWPCMGLIWKATAHIKVIEISYMDHSSSHIFSILGPHMSHINSFGKGSFVFLGWSFWMRRSMMATVLPRGCKSRILVSLQAFRMSLLIVFRVKQNLNCSPICLFEGFYSNFPASTLNIFI